MGKLMISVAGIRGTVGDSLIPEEFLQFAAAFCSTLENKTVVLGMDTRPSRHMVRHLVLGAALATGCRVLELGICPTPTVGLMTAHLGAGGGIAITASHNPLEWNALKFFSPRGVFLPQPAIDRILERFRERRFDYRPYNELGSVETVADPCGVHLARVLGAVDTAAIARVRPKVVIDLCNGAGGALLPALLDRLGCEATTVFADPARAFERPAEPLTENLGALCRAVVERGAAIGLAVDPDADRLALVDATGRPIGEERTLALVSRYVLGRQAAMGAALSAPLVVNLSTSRAMDDVAAEFGTRVERTRIGEANVVERLLAVGGIIGGEGNGGVIYPAVHPGRDSATGIALILAAMATSGKSLAELNAEVPDYVLVKSKASVEGKDIAAVLARLRALFGDAQAVDETDGLKMVWGDRWLHVRPSGTEPIVRVFAEAPTRAAAEALAQRGMEVVEKG